MNLSFVSMFVSCITVSCMSLCALRSFDADADYDDIDKERAIGITALLFLTRC